MLGSPPVLPRSTCPDTGNCETAEPVRPGRWSGRPMNARQHAPLAPRHVTARRGCLSDRHRHARRRVMPTPIRRVPGRRDHAAARPQSGQVGPPSTRRPSVGSRNAASHPESIPIPRGDGVGRMCQLRVTLVAANGMSSFKGSPGISSVSAPVTNFPCVWRAASPFSPPYAGPMILQSAARMSMVLGQ